MGGSGGSSYGSDFAPAELRRRALQDLEQQDRTLQINEVLAEALREFNDRRTEQIRERLDEIRAALGEVAIDLDRLLFGGSVAKHTYVDGLSDVDALVVVNSDATPGELVRRFRNALAERLGADVEVTAGRLAVTVKYRDGSEIQLLPAVERGGRTSIASEDGRSWRLIRPHKFAEKLTAVNRANAGGVVPAIKLGKAAMRGLPEHARLSGYHVEAIAVDAFKGYSGRRDPASMLVRLVEHAAHAVQRPTGDITGQSVHIDSHLGPANSSQRAAISAELSAFAARLRSCTAAEMRRLLDD